MSESYKCNRKYTLSNLDGSFAVLSDEEAANVYGGFTGQFSQELAGAGTGNNANLSERAQHIADQTQAMLTEQRAFQLQMAIIKYNNASQQAVIRGSKQQND